MGALDQSIQVLKVITPVLDMVPAIGGNLKGAAELASEICEMIKTIKENHEGYEALGNQVVHLLTAISGELENAELNRVGEMGQKVAKLIKLLKKIQAAVSKRARTESQSDHAPPPTGACDRISSLLCNAATDVIRVSADTKEIESMREELQEVIQEFNLTAVMRTEMKVDAVRELAGRMMTRMSELQNRIDAALQDSSERGVRNDRVADIECLSTLKPVIAAAWDVGDRPTCTPSTRTLILDEAMTWAGGSGGSCVFWMNGLAGTGKSTIARTLCSHLAARRLLGASFFANRQDQARRDASNIVRTIAYQLALRQRSFSDKLCAQLREAPVSASGSLESQIMDFVINPAIALSVDSQAPLVIVIDALDECFTDDRGRPAGDLLLLLVRGLFTLSGRLRLFLTSRAEPAIHRMFEQSNAGGAHALLRLHDLDDSVVQADIATFLRHSFEQIRNDMPRLALTHWPSSDDLEQLVELSGSLFIYASAVIRFVRTLRYGPRDRLAQVLGQQRVASLTTPYKFLDALYMQVLEEAAGISMRNPEESILEPDEVNSLCRRVRAVLAVIVLVQEPLQADAVAVLSGVRHDEALITIEDLSPLLLMKDGEPVRVFHRSFPDFVLDRERCHEPRLHLEPADDHSSLALQCLRIMNVSLCYNICELRDPDIPNVEVADLKVRLTDHVSDALRYACCFWMIHITASGPPDVQLRDEVMTFCRKHLFHWLEVLSLLEFWSTSGSELLRVIEWCKNYDVGTPAIGVAELLQDTVQVLQLYGIPIRSHALHLYYSAFVTMSTCPLLQTLAQEHVSDTLPSLLSPRAAHLGREVRALVGHQYSAECVAYSPDGTRIVSGSKDCTLRVWSANTGEELGKIQGHTDWVTSTVFTPDGACIISGSLDCTVRVWSTGELQPLAIMQGHQQRVSSVAVSPDGTRIISGSWDATVRVWCSSSFLELERLEVDGSGVFSVAFSPKGDRIVSASSGTVHVFHAVTLECLTELDAVISTVPTAPNYFSCVTFSNTGTHIFAGTRSGKVRAWVVATYRELAVLEQKTGSVDCVSVSPDGTLVLSGDAEMGFISVWNAKSRREITKFHAHEKGILCIAFSPDGTCFVTGGKDKTLRIWVTGMYDDIPVKSKSWAKRMERIVFSTDGARVMSQSLDVTSQIPEEQYSTARVYGVTPFKDLGQVEPMTLFAFSPDGTQAAVASTSELGDRSLRVWDIVHFRAVTTLAQLPNGTNVVRSLVYSPDGTRIVCGKPGGDIQSWSAVTFEKLAQFRAHGEWHVLFVMFSADGECLFSSPGFSHIRMWSATTFKKIGDIALPIRTSMNCMSISQLASCVVAGLSDDTVRVWSAVTHQELARFDVHSMLKHVAFVSHGVDFLTLNAHGETRAWKSHDINNNLWLESSLSAVQLPSDGTAGALGISMLSHGWLRCWIHSQARLIWLPHDRQGTVYASSGERVAVLADTGTLTILTFSTRKS